MQMKKIATIPVVAAAILMLASFQKKPAFDLKASIARGKEVYTAQCLTCHMEFGEGADGVYPPLAKSDFLMADKKRSITTIFKGLTGKIVVNGITYETDMAALDLKDEDVSDVLNFIRNSWGNKGEVVRPEEVKALR